MDRLPQRLMDPGLRRDDSFSFCLSASQNFPPIMVRHKTGLGLRCERPFRLGAIMKNWIAALFAAFLLLPVSGAWAGELGSLGAVKTLTDTAMKDIAGGKIDAGFKALQPYVAFSQEEFGEFKAHVAEQMPQARMSAMSLSRTRNSAPRSTAPSICRSRRSPRWSGTSPSTRARTAGRSTTSTSTTTSRICSDM